MNVRSFELETTELIASWRSQGFSIGLCHGVFDLVHAGHIEHFKEAKLKVDKLVVSVTTDIHVNKGSGRPIYSLKNRESVLRSISHIDLVIASDFSTAEQSIELIKPDYFIKGPDYKEAYEDLKLQAEIAVVKKNGGEIYFTNGPKLSSSFFANNFSPLFSSAFIEWLRNNYDTKTLELLIERLLDSSNLDVVIHGDSIVDRYVMCNALGKSGKVPLLVFHEESEKLVLGGVLAIAKNTSELARTVKLNTILSREVMDAILLDLRNFANLEVVNSKNAKSNPKFYLKTRFLERNTKQPMFVTYKQLPQLIEEQMKFTKLCHKYTQNKVDDTKLDILVDYGHGYLSPETTSALIDSSTFAAVNLQLNAGSSYPNDISHYRGTEVIFLNRREMVWHFGHQESSYLDLLPGIFESTLCTYLVITLGDQGVVVAHKDGDLVQVPSLSDKVLDRVGAGDALLSIAAIACFLKMELKDIGLLGNIAANLNLAHLGNTYTLRRKDVIRELKLLINHI